MKEKLSHSLRFSLNSETDTLLKVKQLNIDLEKPINYKSLQKKGTSQFVKIFVLVNFIIQRLKLLVAGAHWITLLSTNDEQHWVTKSVNGYLPQPRCKQVVLGTETEVHITAKLACQAD